MASYHVTVVDPGGDKSGDSWANAMDMATFVAHAEGSGAAGDRYFVKEGTYTIGEVFDMSTQDGTAASPIWIIGVKSGTTNEGAAIVVGDHATGDNRPLFAMEANAFTMAAYWKMYNIRFTGSHGNGILMDNVGYDVLFNCKSSHSGDIGIYSQNNGAIIACESTGSTTGIYTGANTNVVACYVHDVTTGVQAGSAGMGVYLSVIDTCTGDGVDINSRDNCRVINNTIYNCGKGIDGDAAAHNCIVVNNILDANAVGVDWQSQTWCNYLDFNCWDNTDDIQDTDVELGFYAVTGDPGMAGPAGGDFTVDTGDNVHNAGLDAGQFTGATV